MLKRSTSIFLAASLAAAGLAYASPSSKEAAITKHVEGENFKLDTSAGDCKVGAECTATIKIEAKGEFHINKEFPYKLEMADAEGVEFSGGKVCSNANGNFSAQEKTAEMKIKFKASKAGDLTLKGTYKLTVCTDKNCPPPVSQEIAVELKIKK